MYGSPPIGDYINIMENLQYEKFKNFKQKFFRNLRFEWLVCGHLTEKRAVELCDIALQSIDHRAIERDDLHYYQQMVKIPNKTVFDFDKAKLLTPIYTAEKSSNEKANPNSCCCSYF